MDDRFPNHPGEAPAAGPPAGPAAAADDLFPQPSITVDINPLVRAIAQKQAVVFVGAGASMSVGLPSWKGFLNFCLREARRAAPRKKTWRFIRQLLRRGDFLTAAELIQQEVGNELQRYISEAFGQHAGPSGIQHAIARIPFSLAVTTNYDNLLESAYRERPSVWTWRDPHAVFAAVRNQQFCVIKTHGQIGDAASLVLTKTQYRNLTHLNEAFNHCLRTLLMYRTFLFVGYSFRDHDLLDLLDEIKVTFESGFGPHYAILFHDKDHREMDRSFAAYLENTYSIKVILCKLGEEDDPARPPAAGAARRPDPRTAAVTDVLTEISGKVAAERQQTHQSLGLGAPLFNQRTAMHSLLQRAVELTGADRADLYLITDERLQTLSLFASHPAPLPRAANPVEHAHHPDPGGRTSVPKLLLLKGNRRTDYAYIPDTKAGADEIERQLCDQGYAGATYAGADTRVRCSLATPIYADGRRVGVIVVESALARAFTRDHLHVLHRDIAERAGMVYYEARQRQSSCAAFSPWIRKFDNFEKIMQTSRLLRDLGMRFILYELDYTYGRMTAFPKVSSKGSQFGFWFDEPSLATWVLTQREPKVIPSAEEHLTRARPKARPPADGEADRPKPLLSKKGVDYYGISGPVYAMPVQAGGHTVSVLVAWPTTPGPAVAKATAVTAADNRLHRAQDHLYRMTRLIIDDPSFRREREPAVPPAGAYPASRQRRTGEAHSAKLQERIREALEPLDKGESWTYEWVNDDPAFCDNVIAALLRCLLIPEVGLQRVRLWRSVLPRRVPGAGVPRWLRRPDRFVCSYSVTTNEATHPGHPSENAYRDLASPATDPYCRYTLDRYTYDPYAQVQHRSMFGDPDPNHTKLHKHPDGTWIVAPVVRTRVVGSGGGKLSAPQPGGPAAPAVRPRVARSNDADEVREVDELLGFISADTHVPDPADPTGINKNEPPAEQQLFQLRALDLIANLLMPAMRFDRGPRTDPPAAPPPPPARTNGRRRPPADRR